MFRRKALRSVAGGGVGPVSQVRRPGRVAFTDPAGGQPMDTRAVQSSTVFSLVAILIGVKATVADPRKRTVAHMGAQ
jgi:hypothetical protein